MNRFLLGGLAALVMAGIGLFWWQGRAEVESAAPPPAATASFDPEDLPSSGSDGVTGPELPEATALTREQRRFGRYDRNSDGLISRNEMLSTRTAGFRKLDKDGNNLLSFEEWAVATVDKFEAADTNHDDQLTRQEFAATAPAPKPKSKCSC